VNKREKLERQGAQRVINSLNDLFSMISDVENDEGYQVAGEHLDALHALHADLLKKITTGD
jgi:hypothetical protein